MRHRFVTWSCGPAVAAIVLALTVTAGSVSEAIQDADPIPSPHASPMASPVPTSAATTDQLIVGEVTIEVSEHGFAPERIDSAAGRDIAITLVNTGNQPHNFTIEELDIDVDLKPGETTTIQIDSPDLGQYRYFSDLPGDDFEGVMTVFI